ncbi:MAG: hypothetical protein H7836_13120 [Magnetococcus sp. YQC-3]
MQTIILKRPNKQIIKAVNTWQSRNYYPLLCEVDITHGKLIPVVENGEVVLKCPQGDFTRTSIPDIVKDCLRNNKNVELISDDLKKIKHKT